MNQKIHCEDAPPRFEDCDCCLCELNDHEFSDLPELELESETIESLARADGWDDERLAAEYFENAPDTYELSQVNRAKLLDRGDVFEYSATRRKTWQGKLDHVLGRSWGENADGVVIYVGFARKAESPWERHAWITEDGVLVDFGAEDQLEEYYGYALTVEESLNFFFCQYLMEINESAAEAIADCAKRFPHVFALFQKVVV